jgi:hypothetical protein
MILSIKYLHCAESPPVSTFASEFLSASLSLKASCDALLIASGPELTVKESIMKILPEITALCINDD